MLRRTLRLGVFLLGATWAAAPAAAKDPAGRPHAESAVYASDRLAIEPCANASPDIAPNVTIVPVIADVIREHSLDSEGLDRLKKRGMARELPAGFRLFGLTTHDLELDDGDVGATLAWGGACAGVADGKIRIRLVPRLYVAREIAPSSCLYREIVAHEEKHLAVGERLFRAFAAEATELLRRDLERRPYLTVAYAGDAERMAMRRVDAAIRAAYRSFRENYVREQAAIDSDAEYERVAAACRDAGQDLK